MNENPTSEQQQPVRVRQLTPDDAIVYRALRLESLQNNPEAFASTLDAEEQKPISWFAERLDRTAVFGTFCGSTLVGVAGFFVQQGPKMAHKGVLWGMYVSPQSRKGRIGRKLVEAVIDHARRHVELIQLTVVSENRQAIGLYAAVGFSAYGVEKNALKQGEHYFDEVLMVKNLRSE